VSQVNTLALASHRIFNSGCRHDSSPEQLPRFVNTTKTFKNGNYDDSLPHNLDPGPVRHVRSADSHARSMARSATNAGRPCSDNYASRFAAPRGQVVAQCNDSNPDRLKNSEPILGSNTCSRLRNVKKSMFSCFCGQRAGVFEWFSHLSSLGLPQL
jgi:hypothetical protein